MYPWWTSNEDHHPWSLRISDEIILYIVPHRKKDMCWPKDKNGVKNMIINTDFSFQLFLKIFMRFWSSPQNDRWFVVSFRVFKSPAKPLSPRFKSDPAKPMRFHDKKSVKLLEVQSWIILFLTPIPNNPEKSTQQKHHGKTMEIPMKAALNNHVPQ